MQMASVEKLLRCSWCYQYYHFMANPPAEYLCSQVASTGKLFNLIYFYYILCFNGQKADFGSYFILK